MELQPLGAGPLEPETGDDVRVFAGDGVAPRAPHNPHQALVRAGDEKVTTLVERALGDGNVPAIAHAMTTMALRFEEFVTNIDALNRALGAFRDQVSVPLREELHAIRYNLGDQTTTAVSQLTGLLHQFDRGLTALLKVAQVDPAEFKKQFGIAQEVPSLMELERDGAPIAAVEAQQGVIEALQAQNVRLIQELEALKKRDASHESEIARLRAGEKLL